MLTVLAGTRAETVREVQGARALLLAEGGVANFRIGEETPSIAGRPRQRHERVQVARPAVLVNRIRMTDSEKAGAQAL